MALLDEAPDGTLGGAAMPPRTNVLGVGISATTIERTVALIERWIACGERRYVCVTGVHGVLECQRDPQLLQIHNASGLTVPDGMPMVWLSHLAGRREVERVYGPDLMLALCERAAACGYSVFLYGAAPGVADQLASTLERRFAGLRIAGTFSPPFRPLSEVEERALAERFAAMRPDITFVGLSTPKQELWMAAQLDHLHTCVMLGVGAAFDFHTGRIKQAPIWMRRSGLEWLYRLTREPRRLWRRYVLGNPRFVVLIALQLIGLRHFPQP